MDDSADSRGYFQHKQTPAPGIDGGQYFATCSGDARHLIHINGRSAHKPKVRWYRNIDSIAAAATVGRAVDSHALKVIIEM
jgi:hypothetical protein